MKKFSAVIIDDEINSVELLVHFIKNYCPKIEIIGKAYTKNEAITLINSLRPDILFLDIKLNIGLSFDILDKLTYTKSKVIFVTAYDEYALKAFKYNAIDYVLKPIVIEELVVAVKKAIKDINVNTFTNEEQLNNFRKMITNSGHDFIALSVGNRIEFIKTEEIQYLKSEGKYTFFYISDNQKVMANKNLGEYEKVLTSSSFYRIHRSYLVNLNEISNIYKSGGGYCVMKNGDKIPIARRKLEGLLSFINSL